MLVEELGTVGGGEDVDFEDCAPFRVRGVEGGCELGVGMSGGV